MNADQVRALVAAVPVVERYQRIGCMAPEESSKPTDDDIADAMLKARSA